MLLWLGRADVSIAEKAAFVKALIEFDDRCGGFYRYQDYFLAAAGLAEFPECPQADDIVEQLLHWRFGRRIKQS